MTISKLAFQKNAELFIIRQDSFTRSCNRLRDKLMKAVESPSRKYLLEKREMPIEWADKIVLVTWNTGQDITFTFRPKSFLTLTFRSRDLQKGLLAGREARKFINRYRSYERKKYGKSDFAYVWRLERGDRGKRFHLHFLFDTSIEIDEEIEYPGNTKVFHENNLIKQWWPYGHHDVGRVHSQGHAGVYVSKYVSKAENDPRSAIADLILKTKKENKPGHGFIKKDGGYTPIVLGDKEKFERDQNILARAAKGRIFGMCRKFPNVFPGEKMWYNYGNKTWDKLRWRKVREGVATKIENPFDFQQKSIKTYHKSYPKLFQHKAIMRKVYHDDISEFEIKSELFIDESMEYPRWEFHRILKRETVRQNASYEYEKLKAWWDYLAGGGIPDDQIDYEKIWSNDNSSWEELEWIDTSHRFQKVRKIWEEIEWPVDSIEYLLEYVYPKKKVFFGYEKS